MSLERKKPVITESELEASNRNKQENNKVLTMMLHERCWITAINKDVVRVQGGWIYSDWDHQADETINPIYIPDTRDY